MVWAQEVSEYLLVASVFLTVALSWREDKHVRVDILYNRLSEKWRRRANLLFSIWAFLFSAALTWYGSLWALDALRMNEETATLMMLPTFPVKVFIPLGGFLLCIQIVHSAFRAWKTPRTDVGSGNAKTPSPAEAM